MRQIRTHMKNRLLKALSTYFDQSIDLRVRIFNVLALAGCVCALTVGMVNAFSGSGFLIVAIDIAASLLSAGLGYYAYKTQRYDRRAKQGGRRHDSHLYSARLSGAIRRRKGMTDKANAGKRVLLVEDNERILYGNKRMLEWEGYCVDTAATLCDARARMAEHRPDAIVLDIMLPDGSGLDFLRELRQSTDAGVPVLLLTGLGTHDDILLGLKSGGDDYLTKPYDFEILLARVPERVAMDRFELDMAAGAAMLDGVDLLLTQKEFALLLLFLQNKERYISGEYLYEKVWKQPMTADTNALKSAVKRLRGKLEGSGWQITWSRGNGYCLERE